MSTGGDDRDDFTEDWFEDREGESGGLRDSDTETWLEEPEPSAAPRDRRPLIALLAVVVALVIIGVGIARVVSGGGNKSATPPAVTVAGTESTTTTQTQTATTPSLTLPDNVTLRSGDTGANVKKLQQALVALGYAPGKPDGAFGPSTLAAVKQFQGDSGLNQDGIAGPTTLSALNDALASNG